MKVLLTHRYFWPDAAPYGLMLREIGEGLADKGHEIHIFASKPSYGNVGSREPKRQMLGRLNVRRCWVFQEKRRNPILRSFNVLLYCFGLFLHIWKLRPNVVTASTFPPVIAAWTASLASGLVGAKFIYHMQDIHPEVSEYTGGRLGRGLPAKFLRWLDNMTLRRSHVVIVLSKDMENTLHNRGFSNLPIRIIGNFSLDVMREISEPPSDLRKDANVRRIIFAGNIGRFQDLITLTEGIATCFDKHPDLELFFLGDGAVLQELKSRWGGHKQVRFSPFLPYSQARELIEESDVGLVSLAPNIYRVAYPSKVQTYASLGLRILALVEPDSNLARDLEAQERGAAPSCASPRAIGEALEKVLSMPVPERENSFTELTRILNDWVSTINRINKL